VTTAALTGTSILQYHIGPRLGSGGMGEVYIADDRRLGRQVALKFLPPDRRRDADSRARLFREAQAASLLQSPHIAVTYDLIEHDDAMFIAMEYVEGELISERVARGPIPVSESLDIAAQVADALDEAHGRGVTHRDIKSANLIQTRRGLVKVLDFGLAKMEIPASVEATLQTQPDILVTAPGMVLGTIAYMAPEQLRGDGVDHRVDLWGLGVVLYEMLTATLPFRGNTLAAVFDQILHQDPPSPAQVNSAVPLDVVHIVRRALQKTPVSRYNAARDMYNALRHAARKIETGTSSMYTALAQAAHEPVLKQICQNIAADEFRHYKLFYSHLKRYLAREKLSVWRRLRVAFGRAAETEDDELAYAYYAANHRHEGPYHRRTYVERYARRTFRHYRYGHVERGLAMIFKAVGLKPHSWLNRFTATVVHRLIRWRVRRFELREIKAAAAA